MIEENVIAEDSATATLEEQPNLPMRIPVIVTAQHGIFKNGQHYKKGAELDMDRATAKAFMDLGEVEECVV